MTPSSGMVVVGISEAPVDKEALRGKYREERDKQLRPDGNGLAG